MPARPFTSRALSEPALKPPLPADSNRPSLRRGREAAALLLFAAAAFIALGLGGLRVDPHDPGVVGSNWVGPVGAALAGMLGVGFGAVAWLVPLELGLLGSPLLRGKPHDGIGLRVAADLVVGIVLCALVQVVAPELTAFGNVAAGGNVGLLFGELMRGLFSTVGSILVGSTVVGLILIGRARFSFIAGCHRALALARVSSVALGRLARRLGDAWSQARALRRQKAEAERAAVLPIIDERAPDEAIIAQLEEDDADWIPIENTGPPPLALSQALRQGADTALFSSNLETPAAAAAVVVARRALDPSLEEKARSDDDAATDDEDEDEDGENDGDPAAAAAPARGTRKKKPPTPRIVDTQPAREVRRAEPAPAPVRARRGGFKLPETSLLDPAEVVRTEVDRTRLLEQASRLEKTLADYGVSARVQEIHPGPTVTTFEVSPEAGTKVGKVAALADDLALGLSRKVRIIAPIPGKSRIGFELPNDERIPVNLRELVEDERFAKLGAKAPLPVVLGRDIVGAPYYADLASMPHVIVAGATGAGKSVGLNVMLCSLLFRRTPEELRMLMIDPKVVELAPFDGIPHMLLPVVTDMKQAATALRWAVNEMERRYQLFANAGTKNIATYNHWVERVVSGDLPAPKADEVEALSPEGSVVSVPVAKEGSDGVTLPGKLPYIVIVVDEFADLMMQQGKDVEASVARLAQKARAAGMHVVLATQRPSVDVITGMIKANFPTRIAFRVAQKVDSRTILDEQGAELLLGRGDMLIKMNGSTDTRRVQCPFISEEEVARLADTLRAQGKPEYHEAILQETDGDDVSAGESEPIDPRFDEAVRIVADTQRCSTSWLQRKMTIGYNRAAKIVEMMEKRGIVGPPNGARDRDVLISPI
jgi:S-DNA-T family DNA segregation ATPase FtsK/SpoIIIE